MLGLIAIMLCFAASSTALARAAPEKNKRVVVVTQAVNVCGSFVLSVHNTPVVLNDNFLISQRLTANVRYNEQFRRESSTIRDDGDGTTYRRSGPGIVLRL